MTPSAASHAKKRATPEGRKEYNEYMRQWHQDNAPAPKRNVSIVEQIAVEMLAKGSATKHDLAKEANCSTVQAQKILKRLHESRKDVVILQWVLNTTQYIPAYAIRKRRRDAKHPTAKNG